MERAHPCMGLSTGISSWQTLAEDAFAASIRKCRFWRKPDATPISPCPPDSHSHRCHGFFPQDQPAMIGDAMRRFLDEVLEFADRTGEFKVHFATAREAFNMAMAAVDGQPGEPNLYRNYRLRQIMHAGADLAVKTPA